MPFLRGMQANNVQLKIIHEIENNPVCQLWSVCYTLNSELYICI